MGLISFLSNL